ncbi:MAG: rRNA maturation RNase YbeY [Peptoniphilaceae bacterium]|uniref:rRNA maturation RNase YbeY n=1 Tax=Parvimonas sp. TaxID=1944660 RepID=UPI0025D7E067|nr:rRNA maturation RNase YbeY [Parvimonas sp.]MCI5997509.1 rRNA maturation RNase YbeY [Parvimonas sp.]MDD7764618.1 rRNA maturation RNase YbeY [Peptoniphilaceae bacterium]MDY3050594.1 rRNA maturation RNase YbeY [Parvimonas sp.]
MNIFFDDRQKECIISDSLKKEIENCIKVSLEVEEKLEDNIEISVSFVTNLEIREINKNFRNIDRVTDVLSFPVEFEFSEKGMPLVLGDIVISTETATQQAKEFGHSFEREILYLVCHSMFHLLGYDHIIEEDRQIMRQKEKETMKKLGIFKNEEKF